LLFALVVPANLLFGGNALALAWLVGMFGAIRERQFLAFPLPMRVVACAALGVCSIVVLWVYGFDFYSPAFAIVFSSFVVAVHFAFGNAVLKHDGVLSTSSTCLFYSGSLPGIRLALEPLLQWSCVSLSRTWSLWSFICHLSGITRVSGAGCRN
jgi:hypothetical protein